MTNANTRLGACVSFALRAFDQPEIGFEFAPGVLLAEEWIDRRGTFFGIDNHGTRYLLLAVPPISSTVPSRRFRGLSLEIGSQYRVRSRIGAVVEGRFVALGLLASDARYVESFAGLCALLVESIADDASVDDVVDAVDGLANLFAERRSVSRSEVLGLWGELYCLSLVKDRSVALEAWHERWTDRFDFGLGGRFLEVKTTEASTRVHTFGLDQLRGSGEIFVGSVLATADSGGASVVALVDEVMEGLSIAHRLKVSKIVTRSLGADLEAASDLRWSVAPDGGVIVVSAAILAVPEIPTGAPISRVSFSLDLSEYVGSSAGLSLPGFFDLS